MDSEERKGRDFGHKRAEQLRKEARSLRESGDIFLARKREEDANRLEDNQQERARVFRIMDAISHIQETERKILSDPSSVFRLYDVSLSPLSPAEQQRISEMDYEKKVRLLIHVNETEFPFYLVFYRGLIQNMQATLGAYYQNLDEAKRLVQDIIFDKPLSETFSVTREQNRIVLGMRYEEIFSSLEDLSPEKIRQNAPFYQALLLRLDEELPLKK